jgi:hypothetical protein
MRPYIASSTRTSVDVAPQHPGPEYGRHGVHDENLSNLPPGYTLDLAGDPCAIVLRRAGDGVVARFTRNVDPEEIRRTAQEVRTENEPSDLGHRNTQKKA